METTPASSTKPRNLSKNISAYLKILGIMSRDNQVLFATTFVITILISQLPAVLAYLSKSIIDSLTLKDPTQYYGLQAPLFLGCVYLSLLLVQYVGQVLVPYVNETLTESGSRNIHLEIIKSAIHLEGLSTFIIRLLIIA
jgi:ABC-type multidrug transport system fused ATPase/permease subunit